MTKTMSSQRNTRSNVTWEYILDKTERHDRLCEQLAMILEWITFMLK